MQHYVLFLLPQQMEKCCMMVSLKGTMPHTAANLGLNLWRIGLLLVQWLTMKQQSFCLLWVQTLVHHYVSYLFGVTISIVLCKFSNIFIVATALCSVPSNITNGEVIYDGLYEGSTATYSCKSGFDLVGVATATCTVVDESTTEFLPHPSPLKCQRK